MTGGAGTTRSIASLRGVAWCFALIAAWTPLRGIYLPSKMFGIIAGGVASLLLIAGLRGLWAARADDAMTRMARWLFILACVSAVGVAMRPLPRWVDVPPVVTASLATVLVALAVGIGALIMRVARLCEETTLTDVTKAWRRAGWAWLIVHVTFFGIGALWAWRRVFENDEATPNKMVPQALAFAVWMVVPSLLGDAVMRLARAVKISDDRCPECGYSRRGLKEDRCPECGAVSGLGVLSAEGVASGPPPKSAPRLGRSLVAPVIAVAGLTGVALWMSPGALRWTWRPAWMLVRDGQMTERIDSLTGFDLAMAKMRSISTAKRAWVFTQDADTAQRELSARFTAKKLTTEQAKEVAAAALRVQEDANAPIGRWPDLFAEAYAAGLVGREDLDRFLAASVRFQLRPRAVVALGDPIPFEVAWEWRGPSLAMTNVLPTADRVLPAIRIDLKRITLNGAAIGVAPESGSYVTVAGNAEEGTVEFTNSRAELRGWNMPMAAGMAGDGLFEIEAVAVLSGPGAAMVTKLREGNVGYESPKTIRLSSRLRLVDPAATVTTTVAVPGMRSEIAERYSAVLLDRDRKGQLMFQTPSNVVQAMDEVAFEVILVADGQGFPVGSLSVGGRWDRSFWLEVGEDAMEACRRSAPASVRVILRPSDAAARETVRATKILEGGDIEIGPVERRGRY